MKKEHKWTKEDSIISLFYSKFGISGLNVANENDLATNVIGTSIDSLKMMRLNYNYLMNTGSKLGHVSSVQRIVFNEYSDKSFNSFKRSVNKIISKRKKTQTNIKVKYNIFERISMFFNKKF